MKEGHDEIYYIIDERKKQMDNFPFMERLKRI